MTVPTSNNGFKPVKSVIGRQSKTWVKTPLGPPKIIVHYREFIFINVHTNCCMKHICETCGFETDNGKVMSNHKRWKHITPKESNEYESFRKKLQKPRTSYITFSVICPECNTEFSVTTTEAIKARGKYQHYCSSACAHKQGSKNVDYEIISQKMKEHPVGCYSLKWKIEHPDAACSRKNFSKRELEIVNFFKSNFPNDDWKQGFLKDTNNLSVDLKSDKLKVVIEYDGIWHFKDIHNQLERKQNNDKQVLQYCRKNGYRLIRVDEDLKVQMSDIVNAVYNSDKNIELFGSNRYSYLFE